MTSEILSFLIKVNLTAAAAILAVLVLRLPAYRLFGARIRYLLWSLIPAAVAASFLPAAHLAAIAPAVKAPFPVPLSAFVMPAETGARSLEHLTPASADWTALIILVWAAGLVASIAVLAIRQGAFVRSARTGQAGPAVVGFLRPRLCLPAGFADHFTNAEQQMILAHETTHLAHQDPRINGLVAIAQCLCWFNPMIHLAARQVRVDQESACDEAVVAAHPGFRRTYAQALLKTQLAALPLPLGCQWPAGQARALESRIAMIKLQSPNARQRFAGGACVALATLAAGYAAWAAQPPRPALTVEVAGAAVPASAPAFAPRSVKTTPHAPPPSGSGDSGDSGAMVVYVGGEANALPPGTVLPQGTILKSETSEPITLSCNPGNDGILHSCEVVRHGTSTTIDCNNSVQQFRFTDGTNVYQCGQVPSTPSAAVPSASSFLPMPEGTRVLQVAPGQFRFVAGMPASIAPGGPPIEPSPTARRMNLTDGLKRYVCDLPAGEPLTSCVIDMIDVLPAFGARATPRPDRAL